MSKFRVYDAYKGDEDDDLKLVMHGAFSTIEQAMAAAQQIHKVTGRYVRIECPRVVWDSNRGFTRECSNSPPAAH